MILVFIIVFCTLIALGFGAAAAWSDGTRLVIPNLYAAFIGVAFIPAFLSMMFFAAETEFFSSWKSHIGAAALMFGITYMLFYFGRIGGGDSKLLSVYALWVGLSGLLPFLFIMAVVGGVLGIITLLLGKHKPVKKPQKDSWIAKSQTGGQDVPYGIAIFAGAVISFWQIGYLQPQSLITLASIGTAG